MHNANADLGDDASAVQCQGLASAWLALLASGSTLVCCALPALLVALGAGAALSTLVSAVPQLVWISEHKTPVFITAAVLMTVGGWVQWRNRTAPCPIDPALRNACLRTRRFSARLYLFSLAMLLVGGWFAFVAPWLAGVETG
ncbi:MAG: hypothetical protein FJY42_13180 [Betaproteobacteria bacterium]|nr:hypothetical protein [Betaproteobacteria bacterium]